MAPKTQSLSALLISTAFASSLAAQGCFDTNLGTNLGMGDDTMAYGLALGFTFTYNGVGYTSICVDSNGLIYLGATTTAFSDYDPIEATLLASPQPVICGLWDDFSANQGGGIYFNAVPASGTTPAYALISWDNVPEYSQTVPISVQVKLDATNTVTVTYGGNQPIGGLLNSSVIIGASPGGTSTPNHVSFASRPVVITQNNFADVRPAASAPSAFKMQWTPLSPGYIATDVACIQAAATPLGSGCPSPTSLDAGDDTTHAVNLPFAFPHSSGAVTQIVVSSNGFLTLGPVDSGSGCCSGDPVQLLQGLPRVAPFWSDLDASPFGSGEVYTGLDAATGEFRINWSSIGEFGGTPSVTSSFEVALSPSGTIAIRMGSVAISGHQVLCGYSDGNNGIDPGPTDLSAMTGAATVNTFYETLSAAVDWSGLNFLLIPTAPNGYIVIPGGGGNYVTPINALSLSAAAPPHIGQTLTLNCGGISPAPNGNFALLFVGFTEAIPPIDLSPTGATGCHAYFVPTGTEMQFLNLTFGASSTQYLIPVPNNNAYLGFQAIAQVASDDVGANNFGIKTSNALRLTVGP